jgi:3-oxoacyl-[acyl-carrier protein] reductase
MRKTPPPVDEREITMADALVEWGRKPWVRKAVGTLGLPLPLPQALPRAAGPVADRDLDGRVAVVGPSAAADLTALLAEAGATVTAVDGKSVDIVVVDVRGAQDSTALDAAAFFLQSHLRRLAVGARVIVVADQPAEAATASAAAAARSTVGFAKAVAKEIGRRGATANTILVGRDAAHWLAGPLRFLASARSAFVDGQIVTVQRPAAKQAAPVWARSLAGRVALVTGAARGIGEATARRLAAEGAQVLALDIAAVADELQALAADIGGTALVADITAADALERIGAAADSVGGLHIVVNNAGITRDRTLANMQPEGWRQALAVNLDAALALSEGLAGRLGSGGRIICLSSIAGIAGNFGQTNYATAKAGLIGAVSHLSAALAAKGITVNAVAPGFIETRMTAAVPFVTREAGRRLSALGQGGLPQDVAETITFLASPAAAGVSGLTLRVCGGSFLGA